MEFAGSRSLRRATRSGGVEGCPCGEVRGRGRLISSVGRDTALGIPSIRTTGAAAIVCVCGSGIDLGRLLDCPLEGALTGAALVRESLPPSFSE